MDKSTMKSIKQKNDSQERTLSKSIANFHVKCNSCGNNGIVSRSGPKAPFFNWLFSNYVCGYCGSEKITVIGPDIIQDNHEHFANLRMLLEYVNGEITRYRDYEWKLISWSITFSWAIFVFSNFEGRERLFTGSLSFFADFMAMLMILVGNILLSAHILFVHGELTTNRNWRRQIERVLGFYDEPYPFPSIWKDSFVKFRQGRDTFVIPFILFILITAFSLTYAIALRHTVPDYILNLGHISTLIWQSFLPFIIGVLVIIEVIYVVRAVIVQGLSKSSF